MKTLETKIQSNNPMGLREEFKDYFFESPKWTKLVSIVGYLGLVLIGLVLLTAVIDKILA